MDRAKKPETAEAKVSVNPVGDAQKGAQQTGADQPADIYYLVAPSRQVAEASPYYEVFKNRDKEVLFLYSNVDDFVMTALRKYKGHRILSVESREAANAMPNAKDMTSETINAELSGEELKAFRQWFKESLPGRVSTVEVSKRLTSSPAIIVDHQSAAQFRMMKYIDPSKQLNLPKQAIEINPRHDVIIELNRARTEKPNLAKLIAEQVFDNALVSAGLLEDARLMVGRLNTIIDRALRVPEDITGNQEVIEKDATSKPAAESSTPS